MDDSVQNEPHPTTTSGKPGFKGKANARRRGSRDKKTRPEHPSRGDAPPPAKQRRPNGPVKLASNVDTGKLTKTLTLPTSLYGLLSMFSVFWTDSVDRACGPLKAFYHTDRDRKYFEVFMAFWNLASIRRDQCQRRGIGAPRVVPVYTQDEVQFAKEMCSIVPNTVRRILQIIGVVDVNGHTVVPGPMDSVPSDPFASSLVDMAWPLFRTNVYQAEERVVASPAEAYHLSNATGILPHFPQPPGNAWAAGDRYEVPAATRGIPEFDHAWYNTFATWCRSFADTEKGAFDLLDIKGSLSQLARVTRMTATDMRIQCPVEIQPEYVVEAGAAPTGLDLPSVKRSCYLQWNGLDMAEEHRITRVICENEFMKR
jgi:hypothetical protein